MRGDVIVQCQRECEAGTRGKEALADQGDGGERGFARDIGAVSGEDMLSCCELLGGRCWPRRRDGDGSRLRRRYLSRWRLRVLGRLSEGERSDGARVGAIDAGG